MTKRLVLHERHEALGARFAPFAGHEMPVRYGSIKEEHHAVRQGVGIFDVSHMGEVFVRGPAAIEATNRLLTNNLAALANGRAMYTAMCNESGGIVDDLIVYRLSDEEVLICVNAANRAGDHAWIEEHIGEQAVVVDESDAWSQLAVQGPKAVALVSSVVPEAAPLKPFAIATFTFAGLRGYVSRTGYTGEDGFELYVPNNATVELFDALMAAGAEADIKAVGLGARDTLRLEARLMLYGNDISLDTNPIEAGLGWIVKPTAVPFVGQAAIEAIKTAKPSRRLRGLMLEGKGVLRSGYPVFIGDVQVGSTTSGGIAPSLDDRSIGLAYIDIEHAGTDSVDVEIRGRRIPASVTRSPFYKRATA